MHPFHDLPIKRKLTLLSLLASTVALLLASVSFIAYEQFAFRRELVGDLSATAEMLGFNSASALSFNEPRSAEHALQGLRAHQHVVAACIYSPDNTVFAAYPANRDAGSFAPPPTGAVERFSSNRLELFRPILASGETIGTVYLHSDLSQMRERLTRYAQIVGAVLLFALLAAYLLAWRLQGVISGPVLDLAAVVSRVTKDKNYSIRANKSGNDELGQLIDGFNEMLAEIQSRDSALQGARDDLEKRVADRTAELRGENAERRHAEEALQASERFLQSLVETLPVHIFRKDIEGRITFANALFCQRRGLAREEIIGKTAFDLLSRDEAERQHRTDSRLVAKGERYEEVEEHIGPDGSPSFIHIIKVPVFDRSDRCAGVQGMFFDVTARKLAEARLAEASGLLEAMLANSPDFIYFKDRASRFVRFSNACLQRLGVSTAAELRGKTDADYFTGEHAGAAFADEQEIIRTGNPIVGKLEQETYADRKTTWVLTTKMPWRDGTGTIVGTFGISKDVTALKETENLLAFERDQLRALLDSSPDTIYFKDTQSRFVRVSRSKILKTLERLPDLRERRAVRGLSADVPETDLLTGLTDFDTYQDDDARLALEDEQQVVRTGVPIVGKLEKQKYFDGTVRWRLTSRMPWRDGNGSVVGTFGISKDITDLKEAEERLEQMHRQLMDASRQAGMAEVATGVLHNVGNVLNSINVSATLVADHVRHTKAGNVAKLAALFAEHKATLGDFVTRDPRGQMIPDYLATLAEMLTEEQKLIILEMEHLRTNIDHIKDIVAMQQAYARTSGIIETISVPDLVEDALRINTGSLARHDVQLLRDYQARPVVTTDKHKVLQILINLVRNAKYACDESGKTDKQIVVRITANDSGVRIAVIDNGIGIKSENLTRVFEHGFTTRKQGHGFGLHSGALAAREIGGALNVLSEGPGKGATFTLDLPFAGPSEHETSTR